MPQSEQTHRIFWGLWPQAEIVDQLVQVQRDFVPVGVKPHYPNDMHMTLHFIPKLPHAALQAFTDLAKGIEVEPFELQMTTIEVWAHAKVMVLTPSVVPEPLKILHGEMKQRILSLGLEPVDRPYRPHITLAYKVASGVSQNLAKPLVWRPGRMVLAESEVAGVVPHYRRLAQQKL